MKIHIIRTTAIAAFFAIPSGIEAQEYFDVETVRCHRSRGAAKFSAAVDVPSEGSPAVMSEAMKWICEVLGTDAPKTLRESDMPALISQACDDYLDDGGHRERKVEIVWSYEDPTCVTFESTITDHDSVRWSTSDVATFSKRDGHRVSADEIFSCPEDSIKSLMWRFRGDLPMEVPGPSGLYVGDAGFIDGWVIVIGPARNTSGVPFRIRYQVAEPLLRPSRDGYLAE